MIAAAGGCGAFEDPNIVIDLRVLAMTAEPPDQLVDIDLSQATRPIAPADLLMQLGPTEVCALVADPGQDRSLAWSMAICPLADDDRCAAGTEIPIGNGVMSDPERSDNDSRPCAAVTPDGPLFTLLYNVVQDDMLRGLGGVHYGVQLRIGGETADRALDQYAVKTVVVSPHVLGDTQPNHNPGLQRIDLSVDGDLATIPFALDARCITTMRPTQIAPGARVRLDPIEADQARETYVAPTLDGSVQEFTESLTYQWTASAGGFSEGTTGGPHDLLGDDPRLLTEYRAPGADELDGPLDVSIWVVQRDERDGAAWYEGCLRVVPPIP
jgi:hypothetical protein